MSDQPAPPPPPFEHHFAPTERPPSTISRFLDLDGPFSDRFSGHAVSVLIAAGTLGVLGDLLAGGEKLGAGFSLWTLLLALISVLLALRAATPISRDAKLLLAAAVVFGACMAWRDSPLLAALNFCLVTLCLGLAAAHSRSGRLFASGVTDYLLNVVQTSFSSAFGIFRLLFRDVQWMELRQASSTSGSRAVFRGLLLAGPLMLLFGGLFMAADATFERGVKSAFGWIPFLAPDRVVFILFVTCATAGFLRLFLFGRRYEPVGGETPASFSLGATESNVALVCLNLLFASFVATQVPYLFGGAGLVAATDGLTLAEYVRRGFFELVAVAALVLPMLLVADWAVRKDSPGGTRLFRILCGALIVLLFVIMASAIKRMILYVESFGLTELRLYVTAFMLMLAVVFVWFGATVLRGRRASFAAGALGIGLAAALLVQAANPDLLIARTNIERAGSGKPVDAVYLASLGGETIPLLLNRVGLLPQESRSTLVYSLTRRQSEYRAADWRSWNLGRRSALRSIPAPQPPPKQ